MNITHRNNYPGLIKKYTLFFIKKGGPGLIKKLFNAIVSTELRLSLMGAQVKRLSTLLCIFSFSFCSIQAGSGWVDSFSVWSYLSQAQSPIQYVVSHGWSGAKSAFWRVWEEIRPDSAAARKERDAQLQRKINDAIERGQQANAAAIHANRQTVTTIVGRAQLTNALTVQRLVGLEALMQTDIEKIEQQRQENIDSLRDSFAVERDKAVLTVDAQFRKVQTTALEEMNKDHGRIMAGLRQYRTEVQQMIRDAHASKANQNGRCRLDVQRIVGDVPVTQ